MLDLKRWQLFNLLSLKMYSFITMQNIKDGKQECHMKWHEKKWTEEIVSLKSTFLGIYSGNIQRIIYQGSLARLLNFHHSSIFIHLQDSILVCCLKVLKRHSLFFMLSFQCNPSFLQILWYMLFDETLKICMVVFSTGCMCLCKVLHPKLSII